MLTIEKLLVNSKSRTILLNFFMEEKEDIVLLGDVLCSKFISEFFLGDPFVDDEGIKKIVYQSLLECSLRIKFDEKNQVRVSIDRERDDEYLRLWMNIDIIDI